MSCLHPASMVIATRTRQDGSKYRRRKCLACGERFSTLETMLGNELQKAREMGAFVVRMQKLDLHLRKHYDAQTGELEQEAASE